MKSRERVLEEALKDLLEACENDPVVRKAPSTTDIRRKMEEARSALMEKNETLTR